ncbi:2-C-methyl-D-erythritol 4-phosphate cytidylyltransferase [Kroppenstedtia eburnea]|uniref:2-C-methyl-D-erythritol 4-phosphate cytidylyltransferase n=1 Tax=Kroppenstedtia eburnea TaxID=714067 RepID=A0A1N7IRU7_9BACL|nr:IspD/TarI family cytidylyltransferase [Kroppenstedtia eburnea]QKI82129.1 2-C-methyl-D-erythritol 4-phosphate cytidylyltransferase [Kroppenstedtia eburnea]SIS39750.1 2-C-methyl-D-erythritol 4-phosphate cytidylyltransferase [Kroppenstedtia eburnea]
MNRVSMILLSGGIGTRMRVSTPKQFLQIGGKPMIVHILERVEQIEEIQEIIIPSPRGFIEKTEEIIQRNQFTKPIQVIEGGQTRQESTFKALKQVTSPSVIIHEAVRPFILKEEIERLIHSEADHATYGFEIPFTVLEGKEYVEKNLDRDRLINIQLPQKFSTEKLRSAHERAAAEGEIFTEDVSLLFHYQKERVQVLQGTEYNIKITRPIDQKIGEIIYKDYILGGE